MRAFLSLMALVPLVAASSIRFPIVQNDIKFNTAVEKMRSSQLGDVLTALNGFGIHNNDAWEGIRSYNPLKHPLLYLIVDFELALEQPEISMNTNLNFELVHDAILENEFKVFKQRTVDRFGRAEGTMKVVDATEESPERLAEAASLLGDEHFDKESTADRTFMLEYYTLKTIIAELNSVEPQRGPSTAYFLNLKSLGQLAENYGITDKKTQKATELFGKLIGLATGTLESRQRSLFAVVQETGIPKPRAKRETTGPEATKLSQPFSNLAHRYDTDFHTVFAVTAFTLMIFVLGVFATSVGLWFMDPGRDSIIYRMTSQRMKME